MAVLRGNALAAKHLCSPDESFEAEDAAIPINGRKMLSSCRHLHYLSDTPVLHCYEALVTDVFSAELAIYQLDNNQVLVASSLACLAHLPHITAGTRISVRRCHKVPTEDGSYHLVLCCASQIHILDWKEVQVYFQSLPFEQVISVWSWCALIRFWLTT